MKIFLKLIHPYTSGSLLFNYLNLNHNYFNLWTIKTNSRLGALNNVVDSQALLWSKRLRITALHLCIYYTNAFGIHFYSKQITLHLRYTLYQSVIHGYQTCDLDIAAAGTSKTGKRKILVLNSD